MIPLISLVSLCVSTMFTTNSYAGIYEIYKERMTIQSIMRRHQATCISDSNGYGA